MTFEGGTGFFGIIAIRKKSYLLLFLTIATATKTVEEEIKCYCSRPLWPSPFLCTPPPVYVSKNAV